MTVSDDAHEDMDASATEAGKRTDPVDEVQVEVVELEVLERLLERAGHLCRLVGVVPELGRDPDRVARAAPALDAVADLFLVLAAGRGDDMVSVRSASRPDQDAHSRGRWRQRLEGAREGEARQCSSPVEQGGLFSEGRNAPMCL